MRVAGSSVVASVETRRMIAFGVPSEWCDGRCGRCVVEPRCQAARERCERRWRHEERGEDPDATETVLHDLIESLQLGIAIARRVLIEQGRDPDEPVERPPTSALFENIHAASRELVLSAQGLGDELWWIDGPLRSVTARMAAKAARLEAFVGENGTDAFDDDIAGNAFATVLLLESLDEQVAALEALGSVAREVLEARARFWRALEPLRTQVPVAAREHVARLIARGRAPSPFFVRSRPREGEE